MLLEIATSQAPNSVSARSAEYAKLRKQAFTKNILRLLKVVRTSTIYFVASSMVAATTSAPSFAKQVQEAVSDMSNLGETDPNGVRWMVICISLIFFLAISIMGTTVWYMYKGKKKPEN